MTRALDLFDLAVGDHGDLKAAVDKAHDRLSGVIFQLRLALPPTPLH